MLPLSSIRCYDYKHLLHGKSEFNAVYFTVKTWNEVRLIYGLIKTVWYTRRLNNDNVKAVTFA